MVRAWIIVFSTLLALPALAQEVIIGNTQIRLTPPLGHCALSDSQPSDSRALRATRTGIPPGNRLLAMTANCRQLVDWRVGKLPLLLDSAQYQTQYQIEDYSRDPQGAVREMCQVLRAQGGDLLSKLPAEANQRLAQSATSVKLNETRFLGVLAEDAQACYAGALLRIRPEVGGEILRITVFASTVVKGRLLFYYVTGPYEPGRNIDDLVVRHKANVAAFRSANSGR